MALSAWVNIKIKFANDAKDASRAIKRIFFILVIIASQGYTAWRLIEELVSKEPLTRGSVFFIVMCALSLFSLYLAYLCSLFLRLIKANITMFTKIPCIKKGLENDKNQ